MSEIVNVINLERRPERMESFKQQSIEQGFEYRRWEGIVDLCAVFRGISMAHNQVIRHAKDTGQKRVFVAEDDCVFLGHGSWDYYISQMPETFSMYLSMIYEGEIDSNNRIVKNIKSFSGLTLYCVDESFYDVFLSMNILAHKDKEIGSYADKYEFIVCNPFIAKQMDGYSDQKKKDCKYDKYLVGRKLFGVNS